MNHFNINTEGRDFFVGDIHGMFDAFMNELAAVDFDFDTDRVFAVGDLIDRGPNSLKSLELIMKPWFFSVMGNHEDMMIGNQPYHVWMMNGGNWANALDTCDLGSWKRMIEKYMPLTLSVDTHRGRVGVVHAESNEYWGDNSLLDAQLNLWSRHRIKYERDLVVLGVDRVVVGHTPLKQVVRFTNHVYIDTGAVYTDDNGFLTLLSVDEVFDGEMTDLGNRGSNG